MFCNLGPEFGYAPQFENWGFCTSSYKLEACLCESLEDQIGSEASRKEYSCKGVTKEIQLEILGLILEDQDQRLGEEEVKYYQRFEDL
ncbi:hypothetical protein L195_g044825 [Trifolium pratense]|uniref:Uncharacterized protein n=1 Tax=Trifolium pratense TaxID=57577 RepID=A0A2K3MD56_TRIPR|nr:hypothetical protein L195_g044825 [Trifolium pratense]